MSGPDAPVGSPDDAFVDAHRTLSLFALAIAGRPLRLVPSALPAAGARLPRPGADDGTVRVAVAHGSDAARAMRVAVLREIVRAEDDEALRAAEDAPGVPPRHASGRRWPRGAHAALRARLVAILARARADAVVPRRWPGAAADLERLRREAAARGPAHAPRDPVRALVGALAHASLGAGPGAAHDAWPHGWPDPLGLRTAARAALAQVRAPRADAGDVARAVDRLLAAIVASVRARHERIERLRVVGPEGLPLEDGPAGAEGLRAAGADDDTGEVASPGRAPSVARGGEPGRTGRGEAPDAAALAEPPGRDARRTEPPRPAGRVPPQVLRRAPPGGVLHDEWDYLAGRWLRAWCRVHERRLRGTDTGFAEDVRRRHPELVRTLRERFARMRTTGRVRTRRVGDGEELDLDGLVEAVVDRRAGHATDERAYVRREPAVRDVAAAFLVDMSASTAVALPDPEAASRAGRPGPPPPVDSGALLYGAYDDLPEPEPRGPRRRVIDVEKDALALMADALAALGDACALYGFSGNGRDDVEFHVAKEFSDPPSPSVWAALAAIEPRGSTRMGAAIRHAAAKLARQPASRRLLIVVSDGYPQDTDYGPDRLDEEYGIQDTARALRDLEAEGVQTFCVTVDPAGHDYLRRMCPPRRYLVIDDVPALPAELARAYTALAGRA